jgi:hypothetical protein
MKKTLLGFLGIGAACAACCAIPLLAGLGLAGFSVAGFAMPAFGWIAGVSGATMLLAGGVYLWRKRQAAPASCSVDAAAGCGCATSSAR